MKPAPPGAEKLPEDELRSRCRQWTFTLSGMGQQSTLFCNGVAVRGEVHTEQVGTLAARIATVPVVRDILRQTQRAIGENSPWWPRAAIWAPWFSRRALQVFWMQPRKCAPCGGCATSKNGGKPLN